MMTAAKFNGADAAVAPKKSGEIRRILEAQLAGDAAHRTRGVDQAAPSFQRQPLLNQIEGCGAGQPAAQPIQTGLGQRQLPRIALHRPMLEIVRFDRMTEAAQPLRVVTAMDFASAMRGGAVCQYPQHAAREPAADRSGPA